MNLDARVAECLGWSETNCGSWVDKDGFVKIVCGFFEPSKCPTACEEVKKWLWDNDYSLIVNNTKSRGTHRAWIGHERFGEETRDMRVARVSITSGRGVEAEAKSEYEAVCLALVAACGKENK